jgi:hypothetical protein
VSGPIVLGNGGPLLPTPLVFGAAAPYLPGFTLGLASPNAAAVYAVPYAPPAVVQTSLNGNSLQLSWLTASGTWGVLSASSPAGPWSDTGLTVTTNGSYCVAATNLPVASRGLFFRLVAE